MQIMRFLDSVKLAILSVFVPVLALELFPHLFTFCLSSTFENKYIYKKVRKDFVALYL